MSWQVSSTSYGGARYGTASLEDYHAVARALGETADALSALAVAWTGTALDLHSRQSASICPVPRGYPATTGATHSTLPFESLHRIGSDCAARCRRIGDTIHQLAELLIRAHSLYADAEMTTRHTLDTAVQVSMTLLPLHTVAVMGFWSVIRALASPDEEWPPNAIGTLSSISWAHQGIMNAIAKTTDPMGPLLSPQGSVNGTARRLTPFTSGIANNRQGDVLTIRRVHSRTPVVTAVHSVDDALAGLQRLGSQRLNAESGSSATTDDLDYGTVAVQRYQKSNGHNAWLVVIPGTDGQPDSPFGWLQNVEVMSGDPEQRRHADSVRLVRGAMSRSGISPTDEVVLVGHSQGGIVAAAIASDEQRRFSISHVVTAGSPIAGHPIPERTWVTSIEIEDELVSQLDGESNPRTPSWLTIHGEVHRTPPDGTPSIPFASSLVTGVGDAKQISHALPFHRAAYLNVEALGSPAVQRHEQHFQEILNGTLIETSYWQGRMSSPDGGKP